MDPILHVPDRHNGGSTLATAAATTNSGLVDALTVGIEAWKERALKAEKELEKKRITKVISVTQGTMPKKRKSSSTSTKPKSVKKKKSPAAKKPKTAAKKKAPTKEQLQAKVKRLERAMKKTKK